MVPFALQVAVFVLLLTQVAAAEKFAEQQYIRADTVDITAALVEDFGMTWVSIFSRVLGNPKYQKQYPITPNAYLSRLRGSLEHLKSVPELSARMQKICDEAEVLGKNQFRILTKIDQSSGGGLDPESLSNVIAQFYGMKTDLVKTFNQMSAMKNEVEVERRDLQEARAESQQIRESIKQLSVFFLLFEIVLTGIVLAFFLHDISKRVNELVSNAKLLPEEKPLEKKVGGTDEIAYLDSVLHSASQQLLTAKQNRQSLLNMITHDIRSPLMSSNLMLDAITRKAEASGDSESKELGDKLKQTYKQVIFLVEDLLALEKTEAKLNLNLELFDINPLCQTALDAVSPQASAKSISISNNVESTTVIADKMRVLQVLNNLLTNAVKYSKNGGSVIVSSKLDTEFITISVKDDGPGIPSDEVPHLFEKFFQSRNASQQQGFGLGLAIAKMIVDNHGGAIGCESKLGEGSTFWFSVPVDELG